MYGKDDMGLHAFVAKIYLFGCNSMLITLPLPYVTWYICMVTQFVVITVTTLYSPAVNIHYVTPCNFPFVSRTNRSHDISRVHHQ